MERARRYAAATFACVGLGWLAGPLVGNQIWRLTHRKVLGSMEARDRGALRSVRSMEKEADERAEFYNHIVKNRVDPSRQSVSNPVPDYYCEKVRSPFELRAETRELMKGVGGEPQAIPTMVRPSHWRCKED